MSHGGALRAARLLLLPLLVSAASQAGAVANQTFSYQGFLLNKNTNLPVETPQAVNFVIYSAASGGSPLFTENRCKVGVTKGRYDVEIGSVTAGGIPAGIFVNNPNLWLEIQVAPSGACGGPYESMSPRMRLQAAPYAFNSLYASTAAAATSVFSADTIGALPTTANGAITISTNLFVQGGISVGSISPGQKLAVSGIVESKGTWPDCSLGANPTCGIKFADGSIQYKAAAVTMWEAGGDHVYSINPGNVAIGESNPNPLARLHVSTAAGDTGDIFLVTAGAVQKFKVNGLGEVYGGSFHGQGGTLDGVVRSTGDAMSGPLTLMASSLTVTSALGAAAPKLKFNDRVELSSAPAAFRGGLYISSNVYLPAGAVYYGDGGGLTNLFTYDNTKIWRSGDSMTGQLTIGYSTTTLLGSTLTVTGNAFSVGGTTLSVRAGNTQMGGSAYLGRLTVTGNIVATSSITAQQGLYAPNSVVNALDGQFTGLTANIATLTGTAPPDLNDDNYSITAASGIVVTDPQGKIKAPFFQGSGELLTGVLKSTDTSKVRRGGDTMNGNLTVYGSSITVISTNTGDFYSFTVANEPSPAYPTYHGLVVTRENQYVGVQVNVPTAPLEVRRQARVAYGDEGDASLDIFANGQDGYISWRDYSHTAGGQGLQQGVLGFLAGSRTLVYRAKGTSSSAGGSEVFQIKSDDFANWKFGVGTQDPQEQFHVGVNVLISSRTAAYPNTVPIVFVSSLTNRVAIGTTTVSHNLTVGRGIVAGSSITAQGGFFGDGIGITRVSTSAIPAEVYVATITALPGATRDAVVFSTVVYVNSRLAVGPVRPDQDLFDLVNPKDTVHVRGTIRLDQRSNSGEAAVLSFFPDLTGDGYIQWEEGVLYPGGGKGVFGMKAGERDLVYRGGARGISGGTQAFRIKQDGKFLMGGNSVDENFNATEMFQVVGNMIVSNSNANASTFFASPAAGVGISTGAPKERLHVASSLLVSASDRPNAAVFVSTETGFTGIGAGYPQAMLTVGDVSDTNSNILGLGNYTGAGSPPVTGGGARFMWIPAEGALRAGGVGTTQWDTVGNYSVGFGYDSIVLGTYAGALSGSENTVTGDSSVVGGGEYNYIDGQRSAIAGGYYNVVRSSFAFAGGRNNYLNSSSSGTFVWGYDDTAISGHNNGLNNSFKVDSAFAFLIDPADVMHYKVGVRTPAPAAALDINGDAQFGAGVTKSTFTAAGLWVPRSMTQAEFIAIADPAEGAMAYSVTLHKPCFFNGTTWVTVKEETTCE
ncbi:MAG: hypothetical protein ACYC2I_11530 [Elusimicrobiales bacterium]